MPTVLRPGMGATMRMLAALRAMARSSARAVTRFKRMPDGMAIS